MTEPLNSASLRQKTLTGILWTGFGQYGSNGLRFAALLLLAGLLPATDFGLLGLSMIFLFFAQGVGELGLSAAIVQAPKSTPETLDTAFWANLAVNLLLAAATWMGAGAITSFLGDPSAAPILRTLGFAFPIMAVAVVPRAVLTKALDFRPLSVQQLLGEAAFAVVGVLLALAGAGAWSLAAAVLAHRAAGTAYLFRLVPYHPRFRFSWTELKQLLGFGGPFMVGALLNRGVSNIDYFIVGRWLGTEALGYYSLAFQFGAVPLERLVSVLSRVAFPAFSNLQRDPKRLKDAFLAGVRHLYCGLMPIGVLICLVGPRVAEAAYGDKWAPAVLTLQILAAAGLLYGLDVTHALFFALGRPRFRLWVILLRLGVFAACVYLQRTQLSVERVALSLALALLVSGSAAWLGSARWLGVSWKDTWRTFRPSLGATLLSLLPAVPLAVASLDAFSPWLVSAYLLSAVTVFYLAGLARAHPDQVRLLAQKLSRLRRGGEGQGG